jgi:hypothetical protein
MTIIEAQPGFHILVYHANDGAAFVTRRPVVAWSVENDVAKPVTPRWRVQEPFAILYPDGQVDTQGSSTFESERAWHRAEEQAAERQRTEGALQSNRDAIKRINAIGRGAG